MIKFCSECFRKLEDQCVDVKLFGVQYYFCPHAFMTSCMSKYLKRRGLNKGDIDSVSVRQLHS